MVNSDLPVVMVVTREGSRSLFASMEYRNLREEISRGIPFPEFARILHLEGIVNVRISTDEEGQVRVSESAGSHPRLLGYVTERLKRMVFVAEEARSSHFRLMFRFNLY